MIESSTQRRAHHSNDVDPNSILVIDGAASTKSYGSRLPKPFAAWDARTPSRIAIGLAFFSYCQCVRRPFWAGCLPRSPAPIRIVRPADRTAGRVVFGRKSNGHFRGAISHSRWTIAAPNPSQGLRSLCDQRSNSYSRTAGHYGTGPQGFHVDADQKARALCFGWRVTFMPSSSIGPSAGTLRPGVAATIAPRDQPGPAQHRRDNAQGEAGANKPQRPRPSNRKSQPPPPPPPPPPASPGRCGRPGPPARCESAGGAPARPPRCGDSCIRRWTIPPDAWLPGGRETRYRSRLFTSQQGILV